MKMKSMGWNRNHQICLPPTLFHLAGGQQQQQRRRSSMPCESSSSSDPEPGEINWGLEIPTGISNWFWINTVTVLYTSVIIYLLVSTARFVWLPLCCYDIQIDNHIVVHNELTICHIIISIAHHYHQCQWYIIYIINYIIMIWIWSSYVVHILGRINNISGIGSNWMTTGKLNLYP